MVSGRENFVKFPYLYSSGTSLKEFLGYCKYTANPDGKKLSRLVRITSWVIGLLLLNFTLWIGRNSCHHLNKLGAKLNLLSLIGHWHHLEFAFMTLHPNALYQGTIPMKKNLQRRGSYSKTKQKESWVKAPLTSSTKSHGWHGPPRMDGFLMPCRNIDFIAGHNLPCMKRKYCIGNSGIDLLYVRITRFCHSVAFVTDG